MKKFIPLLLVFLAALSYAARPGDTVTLNWKGVPYKAKILKSEGGRHFVHYEGWSSSYDEWISDSQIISSYPAAGSSAAATRQDSAHAATRAQPHAEAKKIWVLWHGKPYQAVIIKSERGRHFVHYPGWPSNYNEWIGNSQIIPEARAKKLLAESKKAGSGAAAQHSAHQQMDKLRENANRLHQETMQQYRDTEQYYERRRQSGY